MAFLFTDGFDSYGATVDLSKKWGASGSGITWASNTGVLGGGAVTLTSISAQLNSPILGGGSLSVLAASFRFKATTVGTPTISTAGGFFGVFNSAPQNFAYVGLSSGRVVAYASSTIQIAVGTINICDGNYHLIEVLAGRGGAFTGVKVYVDGVLEINSTTSPSTGTTYIDKVIFAAPNGTWTGFTIDDVMLWDDSGNTPNVASFPLGNQIIKTVRPVSDGTCTFGTVSSGSTHYAMVDEVNGDTTDYVEDNVSGHQDLYSFGSIGSPATIVGAVLNGYMHNPGAGVISGKLISKSGTTQLDGSAIALSVAPKIYQQEFGVDPNTSAAWTAANLNSAHFGVKVP
jgi:hypothetical protein